MNLTAEALGIPTLDPAMQADRLVAPVTRWGSIARSAAMIGTYHFYTDDYKFTALRMKPDQPPASGCVAAVEANFSTWEGRPLAEVLADVCFKRKAARRWQSRGVKILVDLNVEPEFREANLLGVPDGWGAYATRSHRGVDWAQIEADHRAAATRMGGGGNPFFVVFGGGKGVAGKCWERGWHHVPEPAHVASGKAAPYG